MTVSVPVAWIGPPDLDGMPVGKRSGACTRAMTGSLGITVAPPDHDGGEPRPIVSMAERPSLSLDTGMTLERERALPGGSVELVYDVSGRGAEVPGRGAGWSPASQRKP